MKKQDKKMRKHKSEKLSEVNHKHSAKSKDKSNNVGKSSKNTVKQLLNLETKQETEHKIMPVANSVPGIDQVVKKSKKQKRRREGQCENELKEKTVNDDFEKDCAPPPAKKSKGPVGPQLTRKQRRNRKKNSSKKNKYKHLSLSKSGDEGNKANAGVSSVTGHESMVMDKKDSAASSGSKSLLQADQALEGDTKSKQKKGTSHLNSLAASSESPAFTVQNPIQTQKSVSSAQASTTVQKRKKKRKAKHLKEKESGKQSHLKQNEAESPKIFDLDDEEIFDFDDEDDDDSSQDTFDNRNNDIDSHPKSSAVVGAGTGSKSTKTSQSEKVSKKTKAVSALDKARDKLNAARFRYLNERLYTSTGKEALGMFQDDPEAFQVYHQGFQQQVSQWPVNPLDAIIKQLGKMSRSTVVADFGCGDARLAESLPHNVVHSFDLVASKPCVTACDVSKVPLDNSSVDVAVFCLSLMGTNLSDYLCEANRVLRKGGLLKIAEVVSRFYGISRFVNSVEALGFQMQKKTFLDKMFMMFTFKKVKDSSRKHAPRIQLKACYYKRR